MIKNNDETSKNDENEIIDIINQPNESNQLVVSHFQRVEEIEKKKIQAYITVDELFLRYLNDPYMLEKTHNYICNQLPIVLGNMQQVHDNRITRIQELTNDQDLFIQSYLNDNLCFYVQQTEKFFYYDGVHYQNINEDDIIHNILSSISRDRQIMSWKQKTKINIMKRIKENNLLTSVPESATIQYVLDHLCPHIFSTKKEAKYFLTILGDNILRKNNQLIHYIDPLSKCFLRELNNNCILLLGSGLSQTFKFKFHDHSYKDCRLVKINKNVKNSSYWSTIYASIDILCVACHYSCRYKSSDNFIIQSCNDDTLNKSVFYLKDTEPEDIVNMFLKEYLHIDTYTSETPTSKITWKNMQYLWKRFLDIKGLPTVMFLNTFKTILITALPGFYKEEEDTFYGLQSIYLESIQHFLQFWEDTIIYDDSEVDFEIEELSFVYKKWCGVDKKDYSYINDNQILDILSYYFPNIEIEKNKFISGIRCTLWDKQMEIQVALDKMKETYKDNYSNKNQNISIYDAYLYYAKYYSVFNTNNETIHKHLVSKSYFEKYVFDNMSNYLIEFKFISMEWYNE
jgi:hypothetical protein